MYELAVVGFEGALIGSLENVLGLAKEVLLAGYSATVNNEDTFLYHGPGYDEVRFTGDPDKMPELYIAIGKF